MLRDIAIANSTKSIVIPSAVSVTGYGRGTFSKSKTKAGPFFKSSSHSRKSITYINIEKDIFAFKAQPWRLQPISLIF